MFWFSRERRDPCFGHCIASVGLTTEIALYGRSGARSGATRKSRGAERSGERALQKNDGAEREVAERGAEVTGLGWHVERLFRSLRSAHML